MIEKEFSIKSSDFSRKALWDAMGYRGTEPNQEVVELSEQLIDRLIPQAKLRYMYTIVDAERISPKQIRVADLVFSPGAIIGSYLKGMTDACFFVATAGREFWTALKELSSEGDIVAAYVGDSIGSVLAEMAVERLESDLGLEVGLSMPYSPGYCGWDIREQQLLFSMFPPQPCGITLSESSLMTPEKSVSGFFAMGKELIRQPYHCEICQNKKCYKRKDA